MKEVGRNDPCPCGSEKKYKNCHMKEDKESKSRNKTFLIGALLLVFVIIALANFFIDVKQKNTSTRPEGPAPAGKVWSEEHGHYH